MGLGELEEVLRNLELLKKCFEGVGGLQFRTDKGFGLFERLG